MPAARRFPPPWTADGGELGLLHRQDHNGHALAYIYFENQPGRRAAANLMTKRRSTAHRRQHRQAAGVDEATAVLDCKCIHSQVTEQAEERPRAPFRFIASGDCRDLVRDPIYPLRSRLTTATKAMP